jgi:hypothetical protein
MATKDYNRQVNGRFGAGNDGGPGRPRREVELMYLNAAVAAITIEEWVEIVNVAKAFARAGSAAHLKWISDNITIGLPVVRVANETGQDNDIELSWGVHGTLQNDSSDDSEMLPDDPEKTALTDGLEGRPDD